MKHEFCQEDRGDICKRMDQYGHGRGTMHGGFCEFSLVKEKFCFVIETNISSDEAALLEPMGKNVLSVPVKLNNPFSGGEKGGGREKRSEKVV